MPGDSRLKDRAQSDWVSETCRNIQVQVIKTTAFNNRLALKDSFGMDYSKLFPGSIFNPPSYSENFISSSSGRWPIYTSFKYFFIEEKLTLFSEIVKFFGNCILLECISAEFVRVLTYLYKIIKYLKFSIFNLKYIIKILYWLGQRDL